MKTPRCGAMSFALALLLGMTTICAAKTFVYVSNALDGNIDAYSMDTSTGSLTPIGKAEAGKLVMPMATSPRITLCEKPVEIVTVVIARRTSPNGQAAWRSVGPASGMTLAEEPMVQA